MSNSIGLLFGFLGGSIMAVERGYKVLPHPQSERVFERLADAKWFLALRWCEQLKAPAGILNNTGQLSFHNGAALNMGDEGFIPSVYRSAIFKLCLPLKALETEFYDIPISSNTSCRSLEIQGIEIDPRYGKVALVREFSQGVSLIPVAV
ncbi:MAG: hypothetical protein AAF329_19985 [Cyanobacteria bacterium P01_A01_bin.17]